MKLKMMNHGSRNAHYVEVGANSTLKNMLGLLFLGIACACMGYWHATKNVANSGTADFRAMRATLVEQQNELVKLRANADDNIDALALRMGELNAHVIRLNALGRRITNMAELDDGEFNFDSLPAMGGPALAHEVGGEFAQLPDLLTDIESLDSTLDNQLQQLTALEGLMLNRKLQDRAQPRGRPVKSGWVSSYFGKRADPMSGKSTWHMGVDFAGKYGDDVVAVSDGVVSFAGDRYGFGNLVEIKHRNGYVTRYAHNQKILVAVGDAVEQGQSIAEMGSTGRSTGPHVHFEVHRNGKPVNPAKYIASR